MRPTALTTRTLIAVPTAVVGTVALSLSAMPALAAEPAARGAVPLPTVIHPVSLKATTVKPTALVATAAKHASYTIKRGDTISAIAARHGLRTADVLAWNGLRWSSVIHPGQVIRLSAATTTATTTAKASTSAAKAGAAKTYTVRSGDTLWAISQRTGVSVAALRSANGLKTSSLIHPGQKLALSSATTTAASSTPVRSAATTTTTAKGTVTVASGDTLWAIATKAKVTLANLLAANGLTGASIIYPGQKLVIPGAVVAAPASTTSQAAPVTLDAEQIANVKLIIEVGRERGVPERGIAIALATAMVESWIRNLDWGDRDSLGLFQQRPSTGWGTEEQVRDARRATATFFGGAKDPNGTTTRGLLDISGWESMGFSAAAQAVQISAYPDRYGQWETQAYSWLATYG